MVKKFNTQDATTKFFTQGTQEKQGTDEKPKKQGRPRKEKKLRTYRYNLHLDEDLKAFLNQIAWEKHTSITQYLNDLIREQKDAFEKDGGVIDPYFEQGE